MTPFLVGWGIAPRWIPACRLPILAALCRCQGQAAKAPGPFTTVTPTIPEIFVLWHPSSVLGETLARRVHAWLRPGNGLGPEVFYRCLPDPQAPGGLPPPLPGEVRPEGATPAGGPANLQIALLLIDCHMIADAGWRYWLARLTLTPGAGSSRVLLPVALDATAYNVPDSLRPLNFLRPAGLPLPAFDDLAASDALEAVARSLLKQLTETLCWLLLGEDEAGGVPGAVTADTADRPKVTIFLSHAKADGAHPARRIRDHIYSKTQLAAFYDENDIPFGSGFAEVLKRNLDQAHTAALIAVRSARYATRPWCRRELSLFRKPQRDAGAPGAAEQWRLSPVLVVDALEGGTRTPGIPEFGNAPLIRWSEDVPDQEEQIVTTVLRDALLASYHAAVGRLMRDAPDRIVLNWVPDPTTLLQIPRVRKADEELEILYPGRGLTGLELDILSDPFPQLTFRSFDQDEA